MQCCDYLSHSPAGAVALPAAHFGSGIGPIFMNEVQCSGDEESLQDCATNTPLGIHNCLHRQDASVSCQVEEGTRLYCMWYLNSGIQFHSFSLRMNRGCDRVQNCGSLS